MKQHEFIQTIKLGDMTTQMLDRLEMKSTKQQLINTLENTKRGATICINLLGVKWVNSSGIDEVLGNLLHVLSQSKSEIFVYAVVEKNRYEHLYNITKALNDTPLPFIVREGDSHSINVVGPLQLYLKEVLYFVYSSGVYSITSSEVAELTGLSKKKASTYLAKLYGMRLLKRERKVNDTGFEYAYDPLFRS